MKVSIYSDERYPDYGLYDDLYDRIEVPTEVVEHWQRVIAEYEAVQDQMGHYYEEANHD